MAVDFGGQDITTVSGADLSAKRFYAVTMETTGKIALANNAGERCIGVLQNAPSADGKLGRVRVGGVSKAIVSAAINPGVELSSTAAGKFGSATAGHYVMAIALEASGADGDIIRVLLTNYQKNA